MKKMVILLQFCAVFGGLSRSAVAASYTQRVYPSVGQTQVETQAAIMQVIQQNFNNTQYYQDVLDFYNTCRPYSVASLDGVSYVEVLKKFTTCPVDNSQSAIKAVRAIERAIMYLYDSKVYLAGSYKPVQSIFVTGIRKSWLKPWTYFSWDNWTSDNDTELYQLISELDQLADLIERHSLFESMRLKATIESYRNWRRNTLIALAVYLTVDMGHRGAKNSTIKHVLHKDLSGVIDNAVSNSFDVTWGTIKLVPKLVWYGLKGTGKILSKPFTA